MRWTEVELTVGPRPLPVTHVITGLDVGGAEVALARLVTSVDRHLIDPEVVSLAAPGPVADWIRDAGVPVRSLDMRSATPSLAAVVRLAGHLRTRRPRLMQTWMYHADLVGGLAARLAGVHAVSWGIHQTDLRPGSIKASTRLIAGLNARLSRRVPTHIVSCSEAARRAHVDRGYPADRISVIPNGFVIGPLDPAAGVRARGGLGIAADETVVIRVGRYHPQKDYPTLLDAAALLAREGSAVTLLLVGEGLTDANRELVQAIAERGITATVRLLGLRSDVGALHAASDVAVSSSSFGEAFPLVVGEAMEQAVPVVVTDVGDSSYLVGEGGLVVPPERPRLLADAIRNLVEIGVDGRRRIGELGRQRVAGHFSVDEMVRRYTALHLSLAGLPT